jgi:branched-chain amino acid transport system permease protein
MTRFNQALTARWMVPVYALILLALPWIVQGKYGRDLLVLALMFASLATGLNLTMGYVGYLPFGYLIFFAIGAYTSALLSVNLGVTFWLGLPAAGVIAGIFAVLVGMPSLRLRGPYFAIMTLAFAEIGTLVLYNWTDLTRGPMGIFGIPHPRVPLPGGGEFTFNTEVSWYYLMLGMLVLFLFVVYRLIHSRTGDAFAAIRGHEDLAESVGIPTFRYKMLAFILSAVIAGIVGGAYAHYYTVITPELSGFYFLTTTFTMVLIGGQGTLAGPVLGAIVFTILPELLRAVQLWRMVIFGALMLAGMVFMPQGIHGLLAPLLARTKRSAAHEHS